MPGPSSEVELMLRRESIVWLSTARPDGRPHLVPIWFWWDGEAILLFGKPGAQKIRNLRTNPDVMLALGDPGEDFDVQLIEGCAEALETTTVDVMPPDHARKYERQMREIGLSPDEYVRTYSQPVRIVPTRFLPWRGRTRTAARERSTRAIGGLADAA